MAVHSDDQQGSAASVSSSKTHAAGAGAKRAAAAAPRRRRGQAPSPDTQAAVLATLHTFNNLPSHLQDNEYIRGSYRGLLPMRDTLRSVWRLHNESGNIWSHLLGFLFFAWLTVLLSNSPPSPLAFTKHHIDRVWHAVKGDLQPSSLAAAASSRNSSSSSGGMSSLSSSLSSGLHTCLHSVHSMQDTMQHSAHALAASLQGALAGVFDYPSARWPVYVFCAGAMTCLLLSSMCHLLGCCQKHIALRVWRLDYTGITVLIVTSFYPPVYYGFQCTPLWRHVYLGAVSVMGCGCVAVALLDVFQEPRWRVFRASMFAALGLFGIVPVLHLLYLHADVWHVRTACIMDVAMGATYLLGAYIYAQRVPERWFPGRFDLLLSSHQIFHVCVVVAAYIHWRAVRLMLEWRDASGGCAAPITSGPLEGVLQELGHELLHIDQVWARLCSHAVSHVWPHMGAHS